MGHLLSHAVLLRCLVPCVVLPCCVVLCGAALCCAVLPCSAVLSGPVQCCAVLCAPPLTLPRPTPAAIPTGGYQGAPQAGEGAAPHHLRPHGTMQVLFGHPVLRGAPFRHHAGALVAPCERPASALALWWCPASTPLPPRCFAGALRAPCIRLGALVVPCFCFGAPVAPCKRPASTLALWWRPSSTPDLAWRSGGASEAPCIRFGALGQPDRLQCALPALSWSRKGRGIQDSSPLADAIPLKGGLGLGGALGAQIRAPVPPSGGQWPSWCPQAEEGAHTS